MVVLAHLVDAGRVYPAVVEVEQAAHHHRVVNGFVGPAMGVQRIDIDFIYRCAIAVHFLEEGQQGFLGIRDWRRRVISENSVDLRTVT